MLIDASALYAQANASDPHHAAVTEILRAERETIVASEIVLAEADYLILDRLGIDAELAFIEDLAAGTYLVDCLDRDELAAARRLLERHRDLELGLADASLVVLARRWSTTRVLTLDERGFRVVTPLQGGNFTVLPADRT